MPNWLLLSDDELDKARSFDDYVDEQEVDCSYDSVDPSVCTLPWIYICGLCQDMEKETGPMDKGDVLLHFSERCVLSLSKVDSF